MERWIYQQAVLSFCFDLRDPGSPAVPVAVVGVAFSPSHRVALAMGWPATIFGAHDPVLRELMSDVPAFLRKHVDAALSRNPESTQQVLKAVHNSLRNSLHVSTLESPTEVVAEIDAIRGEMSKRAAEVLFDRTQQFRVSLMREKTPVTMSETERLPPEEGFWPYVPATVERLSAPPPM